MHKRAFTILELLIVLSVIALLMGLLVPAIKRAREGANTTRCLNNLHTINVATTMYSDENNDAMPAVRPYNPGTNYGPYSSYNAGGRFPTNPKMESYCRFPFDRPLNEYAHPNLPRGGTSNVDGNQRGSFDPGLDADSFRDPERFNFPAFECPSDDSFNYQMGWGPRVVNLSASAYQAVGTSYMFNLTWFRLISGEYNDVYNPVHWDEGTRLLTLVRLRYPSRFVGYYGDPAYFALSHRTQIPLYHHRDRKFSVAYLDGHAELTEIDMDHPFGGPLFLFLERKR